MKRIKKDVEFDYKDPKQLLRFVNQYGQIEPRSKTGLSQRQQSRLAIEVKRARHLALLPFVANS
ncbi:MAG TPA: 30S ribosomal protein S18 [Candidatus Saccharimonadales bacterium]|nr:30S ribosomal protein S18 [Candidatus Saccharimonadales bacterium]